MSETALELRGVRFAYPRRPDVLTGVDLSIPLGARVGLLGHNGCGKTTLLHLLVGLLTPTAGEIHAFGQRRGGEKSFREVRQRVGLVFQDPDDQLFCPTVAEDVAFGPLNLGWDRAEVRAAVTDTLAHLGLEGYGDRVSHHLSMGERRLVCLASVLSMRPDVLLLDEPGVNLDPPGRRRVLEALQNTECGWILVSHDQSLLRRLCDRVILLDQGAIAADAPAADLLDDQALLAHHDLLP